MSMDEYNVAVAGGGPVGGNVAKTIAEKKYKVAIFEQNRQIGEPLRCAGLVTPRVFDFLDFPRENVVQNKIMGARIHSPSDNVLTIGGDKAHALVIDRSKFDKEIIKSARKNGAEIFLENKVLSSQKIKNHIELATSKKPYIKCDLLIGADGPHSQIRDRFGLPSPAEFLVGIGAEVTGTSLNSKFVEIFVGENIAPGFFAWIIPTSKTGTEARIGLCVGQAAPHSPKHYFDNFFKNKPSRTYLENVEIKRRIGGVIPVGPIEKSYTSNILLVGDAASQVKPTSGGGVYSGLLCGTFCSSTAIEALEKKNFTQQFLKKYHKLWMSEIGRELNMGMKFRKIFKKLTDKQFDKYIEKFKNPKITNVISKYGDIDYPSKLVTPLLKKTPSLLKLLPDLIKD